MDKELLDELNQMLSVEPSAIKFIQAYSNYCHLVDDIVDEKFCSSEFVTSVTQAASDVFNSNFWLKYNNGNYNLYIIDALINNDYADSNLWLNSDLKWKHDYANLLRCSMNNMLFAVIFIVAGRDALRKVSLRIRESGIRKEAASLNITLS